jgi:hypothetical protein
MKQLHPPPGFEPIPEPVTPLCQMGTKRDIAALLRPIPRTWPDADRKFGAGKAPDQR